ncbi:MAG: hypothetical protein WBL28_08015 [Methylotenera sp.]
MPIERDTQNLNITVVHTAQGDIRFDFGDADRKVEVNIPQVSPFKSFDEKGRKELETLMDKTFNPPADSTQELKDLQAKFNATIIATQNGKPLEIGTSEKLTSLDTGGGGLLRKLDTNGQTVQDVALGINLAEVVKTPYKDTLGRQHFMHPEDIFRHELFHYVDKAADPNRALSGSDDPAIAPLFKERRAVWFVNQFQSADTPPREQRTSYMTPDFKFDHGLAGSDGRVTGKQIPGITRGYPEPSPDDHREYPWNQHKKTENNFTPDPVGEKEKASGKPEQHSSVINMSDLEKLAHAYKELGKLPELQRGAAFEQLAVIANNKGMVTEETQSLQLGQNP